jgi:PemK-like protein.
MLKPGDIATALFNFPDQTGAKRRPVLVISSEEHNIKTGNAVVLAISSRPPKNGYDQKVESCETSGLNALSSTVRTGQVLTISCELLQKIGFLPEEQYRRIKPLLAKLFCLNFNLN